MRILITGSSDYNDYDNILTQIVVGLTNTLLEGHDILEEEAEIVTCRYEGAGELGMKVAKSFNLKHKHFITERGVLTDYLKNCLIVHYLKEGGIGMIFVFGDIDKSTANLIELAEEEGLLIHKSQFSRGA